MTATNVGLRFNEGKIRWDLVPWEIIEHVAAVYTYGALKYDDWNWINLDNVDDYLAAAMRHIVAWRRGSILNHRERNLPHLAQAIWNLIGAMYAQRTQLPSSYDFTGIREEFESIRELAKTQGGKAAESMGVGSV